MSRRHVLLCTLLLTAPLLGHAGERCRFEAPRALDLDLNDVTGITVLTNEHDVHVRGVDGSGGAVRGRACASKRDALDSLQVVQRRQGSQLVIEAKSDDRLQGWHVFGDRYAHLDIGISIPKSMPVKLEVGSGDANVENVASLDAHVGSGDLDAKRVPGRVTASIGSGDAGFSDIGALVVDSVGSGDLDANGVRGDVRIDSVGSGDATLKRIGGGVDVGSIGSGDLDADGVGGDLRVRSIGSGDIGHHGVAGKIDIPRDDG
ncbi:MAG: DUF4097 family beta strand repeat-containing protein [Thermomonas sp.]